MKIVKIGSLEILLHQIEPVKLLITHGLHRCQVLSLPLLDVRSDIVIPQQIISEVVLETLAFVFVHEIQDNSIPEVQN